jgi:soluble lytic murein transglycosylase-like protein
MPHRRGAAQAEMLHESGRECVKLIEAMRLLGIFLFISAAWGGEFAVFATGARMHIDRHETIGASRLRLYDGSGFTELSASAIRGFEPDETVVPAPAPKPSGTPDQPPAANMATPQQLADRAADKYGLPRQLVRSVMAAESNFNSGAVSPKGAIGLMQLMPSTADMLGADARDPAQNVDAGTRYLRDLLVKYDGALWHALAAYNAGPDAVDRHNAVPPYLETIRYINRIDRNWRNSSATKP